MTGIIPKLVIIRGIVIRFPPRLVGKELSERDWKRVWKVEVWDYLKTLTRRRK